MHEKLKPYINAGCHSILREVRGDVRRLEIFQEQGSFNQHEFVLKDSYTIRELVASIPVDALEEAIELNLIN